MALDLEWVIDHRDVWGPALIVLIVAAAAPFFPRWNGWVGSAVAALFGGKPRSRPKYVPRLVESHEPGPAPDLADFELRDAALYFHEDSYCLIQLLPMSAWEFCSEELRAIAAFSAAHREGDSFKDIYIRRPSPSGLPDLEISRSAISDILGRVLPVCRHVTTGYGSFVESATRTIGFGATSSCCIFVEYDEAGLVRTAWCQLTAVKPADHAAMGEALMELGAAYELLIVDWENGVLLALDDRDRLSRYLAKGQSASSQPTFH